MDWSRRPARGVGERGRRAHRDSRPNEHRARDGLGLDIEWCDARRRNTAPQAGSVGARDGKLGTLAPVQQKGDNHL